jgi:formimidoylglutamate deiminase
MQGQSFIADHAFLPVGWASGVRVTVDAEGLITSVETGASLADESIHLKGAVLPGLPNLHSHTFQRGMAGLAERRGPSSDSFWSWREVMYRFLRHLTPQDVEAIAAMAMVEMLESGFTSLAEFHYLHHDIDGRPYANRAELAERIAAAAAETGIGLTLLPVLYSHGGFGGAAPGDGQKRFLNTLDDYYALHEASREALRGLPGSVIGTAPHSLRAVTPEQLAKLLETMPNGPIHIHIAEQRKEVDDCLGWSGQRPVDWLYAHASVDRRWTLIHATHLTMQEVAAIAASGAVAGLCPITEANLGDGVFEGVSFLHQGGRLGVGSDSNVEISAPGELRLLEYSQRLKHHGRNMLSLTEDASTGETLYRAALAGGAQASGQPVGAIAPGCRADLVVLDLAHPTLASAGARGWMDATLFNAGSAAIDQIYVAGKLLVANGHHSARKGIADRYIKTMKRLMDF